MGPPAAHAAALRLLEHPELVERARPYLDEGEVDWRGLWSVPPWSTREERVIRAAADLCGQARGALTPVTLGELAARELWSPSGYSRTADDHSPRVLEGMAIRIGLSPGGARQWLIARHDAAARALDVWDWGALPPEVDAPRHILGSRRMAPKAEEHLSFRSASRVFESLRGVEWAPDERVLVDAALALDGRTPGPTLAELVTLLDEEQLASVVEAVYVLWFE